jgi:hypothetical protein
MLNKYPSRLTPEWFFISLKPALFAKKDWICKKNCCQYLNGSCALDYFFLAVGIKKRKNHQREDITVSSTIRRQK